MNLKTTKLQACTVAAFLFLLGSKSGAQNFQKTEYGIISTINSIEVVIQYYNPSTGRVLKSTQRGPHSKQTLSVVETPNHVEPKVEKFGDELALSREY